MNLRSSASCFAILALALSACSNQESAEQPLTTPDDESAVSEEEMSDAAIEAAEEENEAVFRAPSERPVDPFTYSNYNDIRVTHAAFDLDILFDEKVLDGSVTLDLDYLNVNADKLILDANDLSIASIEARTNGDWTEAVYTMGADDPVKGSALEIALPDKADQVRIVYRTSNEAEGLQWLSPEQTAGKEHPFLFSQFQPLYARTMGPLQDTPAVRMTYSAKISTPPELIAVMSAAQDPDGERDGEYSFDMPQPIPAYLLAIAVGDFGFKAINDHIGVYAEDYILDASAAEFADTPQMEEAIDELYGPYRWGRYDMIVLPPSFPFGGMENPRLSFLTPTLIAGDKSLTNVVAHELAHSWSGNLITNATWRDAWLNEGFTSYVENRVMEALYGKDRAVMERALDLENLRRTISEADRPELTALKMPEDLGHPDDAFSQVSYAGGMFFLKFLEERFGRDTFDVFLRNYFDHFAFQSITTEDFLAYFEDNLWAQNKNAVTKEELDAWIYEPGLPSTAESPTSDAFDRVALQQAAWITGDLAATEVETANWSTHEWLHFINTLPDGLTSEQFLALDDAFDLSRIQNAEIASAWYLKAIEGGYERAFGPLDEFLVRVGRGKFIYRLYATLIENDKRDWAAEVYARARPGYHPIAQRRIDAIFAE
ncbi:MAG: cold-active zinc metallopeptidase M1 family protein [Hyphococcus sp.]|nr:MAG: cold-active zinc metallopeptidase M1 family protein [Marinicaulis sp.]